MAMIEDEKDMDWVPARLRTKDRVKKSYLIMHLLLCAIFKFGLGFGSGVQILCALGFSKQVTISQRLTPH